MQQPNINVKKLIKEIEYENRRRELREEFVKYGVRFYDAKGWGFIRDGIKNYVEYKNESD